MRLAWIGAGTLALLLSVAAPRAARADGWTVTDVTLSATIDDTTSDFHSDGRHDEALNSGTTIASSKLTGPNWPHTWSQQAFQYQRTYTKHGSPMDYTCSITFQTIAHALASGSQAPASSGAAAATATTAPQTAGFSKSGTNHAEAYANSSGALMDRKVVGNGTGSGSLTRTMSVVVQCDATTTASASGPSGYGEAASSGDATYSNP